MRQICCFALMIISATMLNNIHAQDCPQALRLARSIYDQGRLAEVETYLKPCFSGKTEGEQKNLLIEAYKLLCLSHIYLEEPEKADQDMLNIKKTDPYYRPNQGVDPAEYIALYETFREEPIFRVGGRIGLNASQPSIRSLNSAVPLADGSKVQYGLTFYFGAGADIPLNRRLTLHGDILYNPYRFLITENVLVYDPFNEETRLNQFRGTENQTWLTVPVQGEYNLLKTTSRINQNLSPYIAGGTSISYLLSADMTAERIREGQLAVPEAKMNIYRNNFNLGLIISAGIKPKVGTGKMIVELRYTHGLTPVSSQEKAYKNESLLMDYYYADPIFTMSSMSLSVVYLQDKFSPKKLTSR